MKDVVEVLRKNSIICKKLNELKLNTRKKVRAFLGVNLKDEYCFVVVVEKSSRFLQKDIATIEGLLPEINFRYKKKILLLKAPICSKAKEKLKDWRILWF